MDRWIFFISFTSAECGLILLYFVIMLCIFEDLTKDVHDFILTKSIFVFAQLPVLMKVDCFHHFVDEFSNL